MGNSIIAGVDIGGSHITAALIDVQKQEIIEATWRRVSVDSGSDADTIIAAWVRAIRECFEAYPFAPDFLGIAMPGPFNYEEGIALMKNQNKYDALYGLNVKKRLAQALSLKTEDIVITNDAACFLKGEVFGGLAKGKRKVLGLTLGTGLGSAMAVNEQVTDADLWQAPFKEGNSETYLSNRWFVSRYKELSGNAIKNVEELAALVPANALAQQVFDEFGENLGQFILLHTQKNPVEMVVLGGNIARAFSLFNSALLKGNGNNIQVMPTILGEAATLLGAASFCLRTEAISLQIN
jgi:glucokinase